MDDQQAIAATFAFMLNWAGHEARAFTEPEKALQASRETQPDILLSNIRVPRMSGLVPARAVRKQAPRYRVVFLCGDPTAAAALGRAERRENFLHILGKPIAPDELLRYLAQAISPAPA